MMTNDHVVRERKPHSRNLSITEMSHLHNVSLRALRFYEEKGLLSPARVGVNRLYSPRDQIKLQLILTGKKLGFSLREINSMLESHVAIAQEEPDQMWVLLDAKTIETQIELLCERKADVEASIKELEQRYAECEPLVQRHGGR